MKAIIGLVISVSLVGTALAQRTGSASPNVPSRIAAKSTVDILNERHDISFTEAPLEQVIGVIRDFSKMNVVVRWTQLEANAITKEKLITLDIKNLRLSQILHEVINQAGGADVKLAYRASGNLLVVSTAEDLGKELITRVYDVTDLLLRLPRNTDAPHIDLRNQQSGGSGGSQNIFQGGSGSGSTTDDDNQSNNTNNGMIDPETQRLIDLITSTVEPDSWQINSGKGTINAFKKQLVVRNNILVHQALGGPIRED